MSDGSGGRGVTWSGMGDPGFCRTRVNSVRDRNVAPYIQVVHPDTISILSIIVAVVLGVGLSAAAGFRVFVPLLGAGIAVRLGWLTPGASLDWVGSTPALVAFGLACLVELTGSLIPAVDHAIDAIAAPMSAAAGSILMAVQMCDQLGLGVSEQLAGMDGARELSPLVLWSIAIIVGGGLALGTHAAAAAGRAGSTLTTAGLANPIYAAAESFTSVVATVVAIALPACCLIMAIPAIVVVILILVRRRRAKLSASANAAAAPSAGQGAEPPSTPSR